MESTETEARKRCPDCGDDLSLRFFNRDKSKSSGYKSHCKMCQYRRHYRNNKRAFDQLIQDLGGKCACCGSTEELSIDHIAPKGWESRKVSWSSRVARYKREAKQVPCPIRVMCVKCNGQKSDREQCSCGASNGAVA